MPDDLTEFPLASISADGECLRIGGQHYDPATRMVVRDNGGREQLEPRSAEVLAMLISASGPVSREDLLDHIWGQSGSDEALTQAVSKLRRAMQDTLRPYSVVKTVPGRGYELGVAVETVESIPGQSPSSAGNNEILTFVTRHRQFLAGVATGLALALVLTAVWIVINPPRTIEKQIECFAGSSEPECQRSDLSAGSEFQQ